MDEHVLATLADVLGQVREFILSEGRDGLRPSQLRVLAAVPSDEGITVTELGEHLGMTKQGTGQFVTQLTDLGLVTIDSDPADLRVRLVRRSVQGQQALERLSVALDRLERQWADRVGPRRYATFRSVLDQLADEATTSRP